MHSHELAKKPAGTVSQPTQDDIVESYEQSAKVGGSAGLNLNIVGALAGVFSSKSSKSTAEDGSSIETKEERAGIKGAGAGTLNAKAAMNAEQKSKAMRSQA